MSKNVPASIRARLKQHADASKQDFNLTLTRYGLERLLYRLSVSAHAPNFLLKGALLFLLWYEQQHRPTRDVDVKATFARRKMALPSSTPVGLSDAFATDAAKGAQWAAFLKRNQLDAIALTEVVPTLRAELGRAGIF
jgi:hypothetical protein